MLFAIILAHVWGAFQLTLIASLSRTIGIRTVLVGMAVGFYLCAPVALLLQAAWIYPLAWATALEPYELTKLGSYTLDPLIEELVKIAPVAWLSFLALKRQQLRVTDCVVLGSAVGSGFGLAEDVYRFGASAHAANPIDSGWILGTDVSLPQVPSVWLIFKSWLPPGVAGGDVFFPGEAGLPWVNVHLPLSALCAFALGLAFRRSAYSRYLAVGVFVYAVFVHAAWNAQIEYTFLRSILLLPAVVELREWITFLPLVALIAAWWIDRTGKATADDQELALSAQRSAPTRLLGTLRAAFARLPTSVFLVDRYVRLTRAYDLSRSAKSVELTANLRSQVLALRDLIDVRMSTPRRWSRSVWRPSPSTLVLGALFAPSIVWCIAGVSDDLEHLQQVMMRGPLWLALLLTSVLTLAWLTAQVVSAVRCWSSTMSTPVLDDAASYSLRVAFGLGALGLSSYMLVLEVAALDSHGFQLHVIGAFGHVVPFAILMLLSPALALFGVAPSPSAAEIAAGVSAEAATGAGAITGGPPAGAAVATGAAAAGVVAAGAAAGIIAPFVIGKAMEASELGDVPDPNGTSPPGGVHAGGDHDGGTRPYQVPSPRPEYPPDIGPPPNIGPVPYFPPPEEAKPKQTPAPIPAPAEQYPAKPREVPPYPNHRRRKDPSPFYDPSDLSSPTRTADAGSSDTDGGRSDGGDSDADP